MFIKIIRHKKHFEHNNISDQVEQSHRFVVWFKNVHCLKNKVLKDHNL